MSADVSSLPPWKQAILERKKRQEDEKLRKDDDNSKFPQMPSWKRDILLRKQQQQTTKNTKTYPDQCNNIHSNEERRPLSPVSITVNHTVESKKPLSPLCPTSEFDYQVLSPEEEKHEHLLPITQNYWLRSDPRKQQSTNRHSTGSQNLYQHQNGRDEFLAEISPRTTSGSTTTNHVSWSDVDSEMTSVRQQPDKEDEVFTDEGEVAYGRGFVNKLLKKFKTLSTPEENSTLPRKSPSPYSKRLNSADTLLDTPKRGFRSPSSGYATLDRCEGVHKSSLSKGKAHSMDNLLSSLDSTDSAATRLSVPNTNNIPSSLSLESIHQHTEPNEISEVIDAASEMSVNDEAVQSVSKDLIPANEEQEMPMPNIVSRTRNVFESKATKPASTTTGVQKSGAVVVAARSSSPARKTVRVEPSPKPAEPSDAHVTRVSIGASDVKESSPLIQNDASSELQSSAGSYPLRINHVNSQSAIPDSNTTVAETKGPLDETVSNIKSAGKSWYFSNSNSSSSAKDSTTTTVSTSTRGSAVPVAPVRNDVNANHTGTDSRPNAPLTTTVVVNSDDPDKVSRVLPVNTTSISITNSSSAQPTANQNNNTIYNKQSEDKENVSTPKVNVTNSELVQNDKDTMEVTSTPWGNTKKRRAPIPPITEKTSSLESEPKKPLNSVQTAKPPAPSPVVEKPAPSLAKPVAPPRGSRVKVAVPSAPVVNQTPPEPAQEKFSTAPVTKMPETKKADPHRLNLNLNELQPKKTVVEHKENNYMASRNKVTPKSSAVNRENKKNKTSKRAESSGPGSLLIRPASNLVVGATKTEFLQGQLTRYNDIKKGEFAPAKKRPGYYDTYSDEEEDDEEVPVTNIDDYIGDVPVTNIDDLHDGNYMPREGDPNSHRNSVKTKRWEFVGAGVRVGKSLLQDKNRTKSRKQNISFNDSGISTFEYPSEQYLLETIAPEPGDFDHPETLRNQAPGSPDIEDMPDLNEPTATLKSTPGIGSAGGLGGYKSKLSVDYELGSDSYTREEKPLPPTPKQDSSTEEQSKPADDDFSWSDSTTSDMLF